MSDLSKRQIRSPFDTKQMIVCHAMHQWNNIIFSDEKSFQLSKHDGRIRVYRRPNERFARPCIQEIGERRSIMVWGAISTEGKSDLLLMNGNVNAQVYQHQALQLGLCLS